MNRIVTSSVDEPTRVASGCLTRRQFLQYAARSGLSATAIALLDGCGIFPAPTPVKIPRVGFLFSGSAGPSPNLNAFQQGMRELGYVEGKNVIIDYRYSEGKDDQLPILAAELVRLNPDVIVANSAGVSDAKRATDTIPIVSAISGDLVGTGLAKSLARPGGNVTGLTNLAPQLAGKRLEYAKEAFPKLSRVGVLWNPRETYMAIEIGEAKAVPHKHSICSYYPWRWEIRMTLKVNFKPRSTRALKCLS